MSLFVLWPVLGYNPVITIPAGATNINVTEIRRSKNYLGECSGWYRQNFSAIRDIIKNDTLRGRTVWS